MTTIVYIDGFNLYYGALKGTAYKWLNLEAFCDQLLPKDDIVAIKYFTARVKDLSWEPGSMQRQALYWRALDTLPRVERHLGLFKVRPRWRHLHKSPEGLKPQPEVAWVELAEEKGSDVNLAAHLLLDGFRERYQTAVVISNDSDLCAPVTMVRDELGLTVGVVNPHKRQPVQLTGSFARPLRTWTLEASLFASELTDSVGAFHKPVEW